MFDNTLLYLTILQNTLQKYLISFPWTQHLAVSGNTSQYFLEKGERGSSGEGFCNGDGMPGLSNEKLRMGLFQCPSFYQSCFCLCFVFRGGLLLFISFLRMGHNLELTSTNLKVLVIYLYFWNNAIAPCSFEYNFITNSEKITYHGKCIMNYKYLTIYEAG